MSPASLSACVYCADFLPHVFSKNSAGSVGHIRCVKLQIRIVKQPEFTPADTYLQEIVSYEASLLVYKS